MALGDQVAGKLAFAALAVISWAGVLLQFWLSTQPLVAWESIGRRGHVLGAVKALPQDPRSTPPAVWIATSNSSAKGMPDAGRPN
jgi:hypothetical protein